ncbi:MAG TPA: helix-turn-helix domain-containing protein [Candidatus Saccharimonadales bacterium]|jgi:transcriptional regulator with XRE-family HTH domain|nr:helix-turn-helix domain-containing protein [Candidatus Saccharimonadales bacterium]
MQDVYPEAGDHHTTVGVPLDEYAHISDVSITPEDTEVEPDELTAGSADGYEITDEGDDDDDQALPEPEAYADVSLSAEDTKILGQLLAQRLVSRAEQWGVPMTPDRAQRAGEMMSGMRGVDPIYERHQSKASDPGEKQPPAEIPPDDQPEDQPPAHASSGGNSGNDEPPKGPPPESSVPLPDDGDDPATEPSMESQESAADAAPEDTSYSESDYNFEPRRRYAPGQLREELRNLNTILSEGGVDANSLLTPREQEALPLLLDSELNPSAVAAQLGVSVAQVSKTNRIMIERLIASAPEGVIPPEVTPQPRGRIISEPPAGVGPILNALRQERGIPVEQIAEALEKSPSVIGRFLRGETHPAASSILEHVLNVIGVTGEEAARYIAEYQSERRAVLADRDRRVKATKAQRKATEAEE